ncbi:MAG: NAD(P)-dependent oxidoreductase [Rhodospirillales bacterium]
MPRILLTSPVTARRLYYGEEALAGLRELGEVRLNDTEESWPPERMIAEAEGCEVIVSYRQSAAPARVFDALPQLIAFVRCAVDIRNIDVAAASRNGVLVTGASAGFVPAVAEMTLGLMLDLARRITPSATLYHRGEIPAAAMGVQLKGATLGVIGYGAIGRYVCDLGLALGMTVLVADPHARVDKSGLRQAALADLLARSDFVVCLAVATEATENLMDAAAFARMKPSAFFVNVSRGNLVDEAALEAALRAGRIAGAALDVGRAPDQMPSPGLARLPNVIATPHTAGLTPPAAFHQSLETVRQVAEIVRGRAPPGAVNADRATRLARLRR